MVIGVVNFLQPHTTQNALRQLLCLVSLFQVIGTSKEDEYLRISSKQFSLDLETILMNVANLYCKTKI